MDNDQLNACIREYQAAMFRRAELLIQLEDLERKPVDRLSHRDAMNTEIARAKEEFHQIEFTISARFNEIDRECSALVAQVRIGCHGRLVDDCYEIANAVLAKCLQEFDPNRADSAFRKYLRQALVWRIRERMRRMDSGSCPPEDLPEREASSERDPTETGEEKQKARKKLHDLAQLKRKILDRVTLGESYLACLLIDQRRRMAARIESTGLTKTRAHCPAVTEQLELWSVADPTRKLKPDLTAEQLWKSLATRISETDDPIEHKIVTDAICDLQRTMTPSAWRKKVCRYRAQLLDQIHPDDEALFLFSD